MSSPHDTIPASAGLLTGVTGDLRHAFRLLWKSRGIAATTLLTLALCIGATTAIFSTVYSLMLKPLPFQEPGRIVELDTSAKKAGLNKMPANIPFYIDYSMNATSYENLGLWTFFYGLLGENDSVVRVPGVRMTAEVFDILRVQPVIGSFFTKDQSRLIRVFDAFASVVPNDLWITKMEERDKLLKVSGSAFSSLAVSDLMANLRASGKFKEVDIVISRQDLVKTPRLVTFEVTCRVEL